MYIWAPACPLGYVVLLRSSFLSQSYPVCLARVAQALHLFENCGFFNPWVSPNMAFPPLCFWCFGANSKVREDNWLYVTIWKIEGFDPNERLRPLACKWWLVTKMSRSSAKIIWRQNLRVSIVEVLWKVRSKIEKDQSLRDKLENHSGIRQEKNEHSGLK